MKRAMSILIGGIILMASCKETAKKNEEVSATPVSITEKEASELNVLCKINGEPWSFTEGSGVLVEDKNKDMRLLKLTFTKYLNPGKEHIGLTYNEATKELIEASVQIKQPGKGDKRIHAIYLYNERTTEDNPKSSVSGQVTIGEEVASGNAQLQNLHIQYEGSLLANQKDAEITVTELSFNDIPFSDVKKEMEAIFKNSK